MNKGEIRHVTNSITDAELLKKICILLCGIDRSDQIKAAECLERAINLAEDYLVMAGNDTIGGILNER